MWGSYTQAVDAGVEVPRRFLLELSLGYFDFFVEILNGRSTSDDTHAVSVCFRFNTCVFPLSADHDILPNLMVFSINFRSSRRIRLKPIGF